LAPGSFYVDAVDVSERVLACARKGVYRENSFRTKDLSFRNNYFTKTADGFELKQIVHDKVRFLRGNILQPGFMEGLGRFDVVFCRNVLIYFSEEAQRQAINYLYHLLLPGGILFTGHAEASLFHDNRFVPIQHAKAFAFYRHSPSAVEVKPVKPKTALNSAGRAAVTAPFLKRPIREAPVRVTSAGPAKKDNADFTKIRRLADEGRLDEAARKSEENLRLHGPSAQWYYLLGLIRDSQGRPDEAVKLLRKAVYLDPGNIESLIHLALLAERDGDVERAANYKRRARRLQEGG
jgi:chemotaxis protein methyltransferase WspC